MVALIGIFCLKSGFALATWPWSGPSYTYFDILIEFSYLLAIDSLWLLLLRSAFSVAKISPVAVLKFLLILDSLGLK